MKRLLAVLPLAALIGCIAPLPPASAPKVALPPAVSAEGIDVYFSPNGGAMAAIIAELNAARQTVDVNAYLITSPAIADALQAAQDRGVRVRIILDAHSIGGVYSIAAMRKRTTLPIWGDAQHKDAHNKVMLIDGHIIITGSFNFTDPSETKNAENMLIIRDKPEIFAAYLKDFELHLGHSKAPK